MWDRFLDIYFTGAYWICGVLGAALLVACAVIGIIGIFKKRNESGEASSATESWQSAWSGFLHIAMLILMLAMIWPLGVVAVPCALWLERARVSGWLRRKFQSF